MVGMEYCILDFYRTTIRRKIIEADWRTRLYCSCCNCSGFDIILYYLTYKQVRITDELHYFLSNYSLHNYYFIS